MSHFSIHVGTTKIVFLFIKYLYFFISNTRSNNNKYHWLRSIRYSIKVHTL